MAAAMGKKKQNGILRVRDAIIKGENPLLEEEIYLIGCVATF
jgi:hypothetical protein